ETLVNKEDLFKRDNVLPKEVEKVYPVDLGDGNYALHCTMRRIYDGVVFDAEESPGNVYYDSMNAFLADIGVIDHYFNYTGKDDITDVETIDAIVPLEYALTALSDRVQGKDYTVNAIELIYRLKDTTDTEDETDYYGVPYWKIIVKAEDSNRERSYYIDALSGKIDF
ncbi:MAG: hypothetical protein K6G26_13495, partial [Lachnospiraceae bacterium]|nr:hypothetical protein [Lachnospiraceae bacterium]